VMRRRPSKMVGSTRFFQHELTALPPNRASGQTLFHHSETTHETSSWALDPGPSVKNSPNTHFP
jgi:hypothetical protein